MEENKSHKSLRLLFLDMDGVCNRGADNCSPDRHIYDDRFSWVQSFGNKSCELTYVDPELAKRLSKLIIDYDLYIVSSSTWRLNYTQEEFKELLTLRGLPGERLIGYTPDMSSSRFRMYCDRKDEIEKFIKNFTESVEYYIILDDLYEAAYDTENGKFFQTDFDKGYDEEIDKEVRKYLDERIKGCKETKEEGSADC